MELEPLYNVAEIQVSYRIPEDADLIKITSSKTSYDILISFWDKDKISMQEQFNVIYTNSGGFVIGVYQAATGGISGITVDRRLDYGHSVKGKCLWHYNRS